MAASKVPAPSLCARCWLAWPGSELGSKRDTWIMSPTAPCESTVRSPRNQATKHLIVSEQVPALLDRGATMLFGGSARRVPAADQHRRQDNSQFPANLPCLPCLPTPNIITAWRMARCALTLYRRPAESPLHPVACGLVAPTIGPTKGRKSRT